MMLHNALDRAEKLILNDPAEDCIIPKLKKQEMKILKPEDMKAYLAAADKRAAPKKLDAALVCAILERFSPSQGQDRRTVLNAMP